MGQLLLNNLTKTYQATPVVNSVNLTIADKELMVLVGPSGSGKTTILRLIAGLENASAGKITIGNQDVTKLSPGARNVSLVFQTYALFPHLNVAENIGIGLEVRGVAKDERIKQVRAAAESVNCADLLDRKPDQLSGGEKQRIALARAIVRKPDIFLLDEPLSSLDAQLRTHMRMELQLLQRRLGITMLYVTHDQEEALTIGNRVAVMRGGVIEQVGKPEDIYHQPANQFVAGFVGSPAMNFIPASIAGQTLHAGMLVGIRPEHVRIQKTGSGIPAVVNLVEMAGSNRYAYLTLKDSRLIVKLDSRTRVLPGVTIKVSLPPKHLYLFDVSGNRLS